MPGDFNGLVSRCSQIFPSRTSCVSLKEDRSCSQQLILMLQVTIPSVAQGLLVMSETVRTLKPPIFGFFYPKPGKTESSQPAVFIWLLAQMLTKASASRVEVQQSSALPQHPNKLTISYHPNTAVLSSVQSFCWKVNSSQCRRYPSALHQQVIPMEKSFLLWWQGIKGSYSKQNSVFDVHKFTGSQAQRYHKCHLNRT